MYLTKLLVFISLSFLISSCAFDVISIKRIPAKLDTTVATKESFKLLNNAKIQLDTGYHRELRNGTTWHYVGKIKQGDVYKTRDQVLTVEGSNIYEAYIVLDSSNKLVGFYLPVEKIFTPLEKAAVLQIQH